jgi:hypothetical protein
VDSRRWIPRGWWLTAFLLAVNPRIRRCKEVGTYKKRLNGWPPPHLLTVSHPVLDLENIGRSRDRVILSTLSLSALKYKILDMRLRVREVYRYPPVTQDLTDRRITVYERYTL